MDEFWQSLTNVTALAVAIPVFSLLLSLILMYLVIRLAVIHALRDHEKWMEKRRERASRTSYPNNQAFPPITPESPSSF